MTTPREQIINALIATCPTPRHSTQVACAIDYAEARRIAGVIADAACEQFTKTRLVIESE
jgi:hypothetical protein